MMHVENFYIFRIIFHLSNILTFIFSFFGRGFFKQYIIFYVYIYQLNDACCLVCTKPTIEDIKDESMTNQD